MSEKTIKSKIEFTATFDLECVNMITTIGEFYQKFYESLNQISEGKSVLMNDVSTTFNIKYEDEK